MQRFQVAAILLQSQVSLRVALHSHTGSGIANCFWMLSPQGSLNTGSYAITPATGLANVTFSGFSGDRRLAMLQTQTLPGQHPAKWVYSGVLTVTEETADKTLVSLYGGLEIKLSKTINNPMHMVLFYCYCTTDCRRYHYPNDKG